MANTQRALIRAKLDAIKKLADENDQVVDDLFDRVKDDLPDIDGLVKRKIDDFKNSRKAKQTQKKDIFGELIKTFEGFLGSEQSTNPNAPTSKPVIKNKLKKYAKESARITGRESKNIVMDSVKTAFFSGGVCGANTLMPANSVDISPKEIDFLNMLNK